MAQVAPILTRADQFPYTFGRFTLLAPLGEGGMGRVYKAWMNGPDGFRKGVALKILVPKRPDPDHLEHYESSIRNEARIGGLLRHPGLVEVLDYGVEGGVPWISMELVEGVSLDTLLRTASPLPPAAILDVGLQLCAALGYAHGFRDGDVPVRLVHRDLKPANVLIDAHGQLKVTDFGIARSSLSTGVTTMKGVMKGTPSFMAPEQILSQDLDARSDLFALGAMLYEAATGERLLRRDGVAATVAAVLAVDELVARGLRRRLDAALPGLGDVVARCLAKDPEDRTPSAQYLAAELLELAMSAGIAPRGGLLAAIEGAATPAGAPPMSTSAIEEFIAGFGEGTDVTSTSQLLAQLGLQAGPDELLDEPGSRPARIGPMGTDVAPRPVADQPARRRPLPGLSRLRPVLRDAPRARGPEAVLAVTLALFVGFSGEGSDTGLRAGGVSLPPTAAAVQLPMTLEEAIPPSPDVLEAPSALLAPRRAPTPAPVVAQPPPAPPEPAALVPDGAAAAPRAEHRRVVNRVAPGGSRSFLIEAEPGSVGHARLYLRRADGSWRHLPLQRVAEGYWGAVVGFDEEDLGVGAYWFDVQPTSGEAYRLGGPDAPWLFQVRRGE